MEAADHDEQAPMYEAPPVLTEDEIKTAFYPFLRNFYKDRYPIVHGSIEATFDNVSADGFVADGKVSFLKTDDEDPQKRSYFTCTYEASSRDKIAEVKYEVNFSYFLWDSIAFSAMITAGFYMLSYLIRTDFLYSLLGTGNLGLVLGMGILSFSLWFFGMRGWKKYRYIFAIEQFKQYRADEQWIAIAEDVFINPNDQYFLELKNQCIFNGFGLAIIYANKEVRTVVTPSRLGVYGGNRKAVDWLTNNSVYQNVAKGAAFLSADTNKSQYNPFWIFYNRLAHPLNYYLIKPAKDLVWKILSKPFEQSKTSYSRFMGTQTTQKWITGLSALVLVFFLQKTITHRTVEYPEPEAYDAYLNRRLSRPNPEDQVGYLPEYDVQKNGIPKQYPVLLNQVETDEDDSGVATIDLSGDDEEEEEIGGEKISVDEVAARRAVTDKAEDLPTEPVEYAEAEPKPTAKPGAPKAKWDWCQQLGQKKGWIIQDGYFSEQSFANERVAELKHRGLKCVSVKMSCVEKGKSGYIVFLGDLFATQNAGLTEKTNYQQALKRYGLEKGALVLRKIN